MVKILQPSTQNTIILKNLYNFKAIYKIEKSCKTASLKVIIPKIVAN